MKYSKMRQKKSMYLFFSHLLLAGSRSLCYSWNQFSAMRSFQLLEDNKTNWKSYRAWLKHMHLPVVSEGNERNQLSNFSETFQQ